MLQKVLIQNSCQSSHEHIVLKSKDKCPDWPYLCYYILAMMKKYLALAKFI